MKNANLENLVIDGVYTSDWSRLKAVYNTLFDSASPNFIYTAIGREEKISLKDHRSIQEINKFVKKK